MTKWIKYPLTLTGKTVDLVSLEKTHFAELEALAKDKRIWEFYPLDGTNSDTFNRAFETALTEREIGNQFPFVVFHKPDNKIIGSTRFLDIQPLHRKLEIGWTWLHPDYWATSVNLECKWILLTCCFERLHASRVQLKANDKNVRSRKAIQKIGGQFEGILRNDMINENQTKRSSAYYSIIEEEWESVRLKLSGLLEAKWNAGG